VAQETHVDQFVDVYRVEHRFDLVGPYNGPEAYGMLGAMTFAHTNATHPSPNVDAILCQHLAEINKRHFGFASLEDFYLWFEGWGYDLREAGYVLRRFQARRQDVLLGARQCVFYRAAATVLETLDVVTLTPVANAIQAAAERWAFDGTVDEPIPMPLSAYPSPSARA
jgi:hypothetical protein